MKKKTFGVSKPIQNDIHLFSMANFLPILEPLTKLISPNSICEIGLEKKIMTNFLIDYCLENKAKYIGIDPSIDDDLINEHNEAGFEFHIKPSLKALNEVGPCDLYIVDGDHNYYTVYNELSLIKRKNYSFPIVILHDIGWPCDRRDFYYFPSHLPKKELKENETKKGVILDGDDLTEKGISSIDGSFGWRKERGNEKNGILTAVEDFKKENKELKLIKISGVYGLGILYNPNDLPSELQNYLQELATSTDYLDPLLSCMEYNRLELFIHKINLDNDLKRLTKRVSTAEKMARERYDSIQNQSKMIDERNQNIDSLTEKQKTAETIAKDRFDSLTEKLKTAETIAKDRFDSIQNQSKMIDERNQNIDSLTEKLTAAETIAKDRFESIQKQSKMIDERNQNIDALTEKLTAAETIAKDRFESIQNQSKIIDEKNSQIEVINNDLKAAETMALERYDVIQNQSELIQKRDLLISYYNTPIHKKIFQKKPNIE